MTWKEAVRRSKRGEALRAAYRGKVLTVYFRQADGAAVWLDQAGRRHPAQPEEVDGFLDWRPT